MSLIYILEDDESIGSLITITLRAAEHEPRVFRRAEELENACAGRLPQLLLLDIMLPGKNGWTVLREWKADPRTTDIPAIVLSARDSELDKVRGLESGAEDYITKPFGVLELQARVKAALRRVTPSAQVFRTDGLTADFSQKRVVADGREVSLTKKELELLQYLCENAGRVITREQLLENVWGYNFGIDTTRTVDYHIRSLRKKLGDNAEDSRFIETVRGFGYRVIRPAPRVDFP